MPSMFTDCLQTFNIDSLAPFHIAFGYNAYFLIQSIDLYMNVDQENKDPLYY